MRRTPARRAVSLALVHHANQYLITDGYDNRQGVRKIVEGYAAALDLHDRYGVPANLHLSGTLIEIIAWHCPWFLTLVRDLRAKGLLTLIGGTYAENVMPLFAPAFNLRQLNEHLRLYRRHLHCAPAEVQICWVPERVWDTAKLAPVLTSDRLVNGGYRFVLLDDRLLYPANGSYPGSPRALFDATGPYGSADSYNGVPAASCAGPSSQVDGRPGPSPAETYSPYRIARANGLVVLPMSAHLRYWLPPSSPEQWRHLEEKIDFVVQGGGEDTLLVYADDLEKTAGVGGWDTRALSRYEAFLGWVASRTDVVPVALSHWLAGRQPREERELEAGTFFELAQAWRAGENYHCWWGDPGWSLYRGYLENAEDAVRSAERQGADRQLLALARKHLLASAYETAWHDAVPGGSVPAPWAKAVASHARACLVIVAAARWLARSERQAAAEAVDVDDDGEEEVVLRNEYLYAVLAPGHGGRLVYLFARTPRGGALVIGNPTDDWNFQQELNRYMDQPPNHPGALADVGFEHDRYRLSIPRGTEAGAFVKMINAQEGSPLFGTRKSLLLAPDTGALVVCYSLPDAAGSLATRACLSPDYYRLLRAGRRGLRPYRGETWRGFRNGQVAVWLARSCEEATGWAAPGQAEAGHGRNVCLQARAPHFHLLIGCGDTDEDRCQGLLQEVRRHPLGGIRAAARSAALCDA